MAADDAVEIEPLWFRSQVKSVSLPSIKAGTANPERPVRVVLEADVDPSGRVVRVVVLDSGTSSLDAESVAAVRKWHFDGFQSVFPGQKDRNRRGRVVFYFAQQKGTWTVVDAAAARLEQERMKKTKK